MKKGYRKCVCCEEPFDYENEGFTAELGDYEGKPLCEECYFADSNDADQVVYIDSYGGRETFSVGSYTIQGGGDESCFPEVWEYCRSITWHGCGWRGSHQGEAPEGWVSVIDDWFGTIDGHRIEGDLGKFYEKFEDEPDDPDFPMIVAFPRTSNVCSCGIEVYVKEKDQKKFKRWLNS